MKKEKKVRIEDNFYIIGLCLPCMAALFFALWRVLPDALWRKLYVPCMFHLVTGLYCPGCGGTRAVNALLNGRVLLSFFYHPIVLYTAVIYVWFMVSHTLERMTKQKWRIGMKYRNGYLFFALALVLLNIAVKDIALTAFHVDFIQIIDSIK